MNILNLKKAIAQIHIEDKMQEEIIMHVKKQIEHRQHKAKILKKATAAAAVFALIFGAATPIQAGIRYLLKERLANIPKQELEAINQMLQDQDCLPADQFSREYTDEERSRMQQLEQDYQNGTFPKQTLAQIDCLKQTPTDALSYDTATGTFYLPDRTLTDEELLEIIDFNYTSDYALSQGSAAQKAVKEQSEKESQLSVTVLEKDGITKQDAQKKAKAYLKSKFGISAKGMDCEMFLDERPDGILIYHVSFQTQDKASFYCYGIDVNAEDGSLVDTSYATLPKDRFKLTLN